RRFFDFERVTRRPMLVMWKMMPSNDPQMLEWWRRIEFRKSVFDKDCPQNPEYHFDRLLTTPERERVLSTSCVGDGRCAPAMPSGDRVFCPRALCQHGD